MKDLKDWTIPELLDLYKRLDEEASDASRIVMFAQNEEDVDEDGNGNGGWKGHQQKFTNEEIRLVLSFAGERYYHDNLPMIHLYAVTGHFRIALEDKLYKAVPPAPLDWALHLVDYKQKDWVSPHASTKGAFNEPPPFY